jgi:hypothetical protein
LAIAPSLSPSPSPNPVHSPSLNPRSSFSPSAANVETDYFLSFAYFLVRCHASVLSLPPGDVIFARQACPLNYAIISLFME